jgi:fumarate reductase subunit D
MIKRSAEPFLWLVFSAGGVAAALAFPIILLLVGVAFPLGWLPPPTHEQLRSVLVSPITRIALFALCTASLFHAAHRLRYTLYDGLQIKHLNEVIAVGCYGGAVAGSLAAALLLIAPGW